MWLLTVRAPGAAPQEYTIDINRTTIGRDSKNDIILDDESASRNHASIHYDRNKDTLIIHDLESTNGTFVNGERLERPYRLRETDIVRIGAAVLRFKSKIENMDGVSGLDSRKYTRELVLESLDHHAVLMYEIAYKLNTVMDIDSALSTVSELMRRAMGADRGEVILQEHFDHLKEMGFPESVAKMTVEKQRAIIIPNLQEAGEYFDSDSAAFDHIRSTLCVPIVSNDVVTALIYLYKSNPKSKPFDGRDLQLAVAISHQAALTIQRVDLLEKVQKEQRGRLLLERFLSPQEVENVLDDYLEAGQLPGLSRETATVMFVDMEESTSLAEKIGPEKFGKILNCFYHDVTEIIFSEGGIVKYAGDGVLAVYGMTETHSNDEEGRAVRSALRILIRIEEINKSFNSPIILGIGINSGPVVSGYVGTEERAELTVLGDVVNVAFRLQAQARPNRILVGTRTGEAIEGRYHLKSLGDVLVRGRIEPVYVYEVINTGIQ